MTTLGIIIVATVALLASLLTFFSGFGLGTMLMPCMALFLPLDLAIGMTAVVHLLTNIFKFGLTFKHLDKNLYLYFGITSIIGAFVGALVLNYLEASQINLLQYELQGHPFHITLPKLIIGFVILFFVVFEAKKNIALQQSNTRVLMLGGILSGFFGGLSGNQGALRTTFLSALKLNKEKFIATGIAIALGVDVVRLCVYGLRLDVSAFSDQSTVLLVTTACAFLGAFIGSKLLNKITVKFVQGLVGVMLILIALGMMSGIL